MPLQRFWNDKGVTVILLNVVAVQRMDRQALIPFLLSSEHLLYVSIRVLLKLFLTWN